MKNTEASKNVSDTPKPNSYETMEALICEMQVLRDELADVKRERDESRKSEIAAIIERDKALQDWHELYSLLKVNIFTDQ